MNHVGTSIEQAAFKYNEATDFQTIINSDRPDHASYFITSLIQDEHQEKGPYYLAIDLNFFAKNMILRCKLYYILRSKWEIGL